MRREDVLTATLAAWRRTAFVWGDSDCLMSVMSYGRDLRHGLVDPGARWRGKYDDMAGATYLLQRDGGAVALLGSALESVGFRRVQDWGRGDIVVAKVIGLEVGGLHLGDRVAFRLDGVGTKEWRADRVGIIAAWR